MSVYQLSPVPAMIRVKVPTRQEIRTAMLTRPSIAVAAIAAATFVVLGFVTAIVLLALNDKSTEALTFAVVTPIIGMLVSVMGRVRSIESKVDAVAVTQATVDGTK